MWRVFRFSYMQPSDGLDADLPALVDRFAETVMGAPADGWLWQRPTARPGTAVELWCRLPAGLGIDELALHWAPALKKFGLATLRPPNRC